MHPGRIHATRMLRPHSVLPVEVDADLLSPGLTAILRLHDFKTAPDQRPAGGRGSAREQEDDRSRGQIARALRSSRACWTRQTDRTLRAIRAGSTRRTGGTRRSGRAGRTGRAAKNPSSAA